MFKMQRIPGALVVGYWLCGKKNVKEVYKRHNSKVNRKTHTEWWEAHGGKKAVTLDKERIEFVEIV
jgi:hypothetical protein